MAAPEWIILLEDGFSLLTEDGFFLLLEGRDEPGTLTTTVRTSSQLQASVTTLQPVSTTVGTSSQLTVQVTA